MRRRWLWTVMTAAWIGTIATFASEYPRGPVPVGGETFGASFETGAQADRGAGFPKMAARTGKTGGLEGWKFDFTEGRVGRALDISPGRSSAADPEQRVPGGGEEASFKAQGFFSMRVGTLSFWYRGTGGGPMVKITTQSNDNAVHAALRLSAGSFSFLDREYRDIELALPATAASLTDGAWHHLAMAWDECRGVRVYLDGTLWAETETPWQGGYLSAGRLALQGGMFDEVRFFDVALDGADIGALAGGRGASADLAGAATSVSDDHRLEHLGWLDAPADHFPTVAGSATVRKVTIERARAVRQMGWRGVDGREDTVWPRRYHVYHYPDGKGPFRIFLADGERFNLVRVRGAIDECTLREGDAYVMPEDTRVLASLQGGRYITNFHLAEPCSASSVSLYPHKVKATGPSVSDRYYWSKHRELHDLSLLNVRPGVVLEDPVVVSCTVTAKPPETVAGDNRIRLIHWYRPDERGILAGAVGDASAGNAQIEPLRFLHIMTPPQAKDLPLSAVRLKLRVDGWQAGNTVNVRVHDPFNLWRALIDIDVKLQQPGELDLALAFPPTILPADTELWVTLVSRDGGTLRCGPGESALTVHGPDLDAALQAYYAMQHRFLKENFEIISEPHPWSYAPTDNEHLRIALARFDAISRPMWDLYRRFPDDRWTTAYVMWTHRGCLEMIKEIWDALPDPLPEDPGAPMWALLQKEISRQHFDFINWWIDNRQVPNGELGNSYGDDSDLLGDWVAMALLSDADGRIRRSQRLLADYCWQNTMSNGLNTGFTDMLHAYEAGNNLQPYAALLDYGNPLLMERQIATSRRYDGFLLTPAKGGGRTFAGNGFSTTEVREIPRAPNIGQSRLILHAGLMLMWYNGHPGLTRMMAELYDGSPPMEKGQTGDLEYALHMVTGDERFAERCVQPAVDIVWQRLLNVREIDAESLNEQATHDLPVPRHKRPRRRWTAWRYTRDKSHLEYSLRHLHKQLHYFFDMTTRTEQSGDRVHLQWLGSKRFVDYMYFGGGPGARNELMPVNAVSYEGLTPNFAGLVLNDTTESLQWVGYSFEAKPQTGMLRVWRLVPGTYEVRMGVDRDGDDRIDGAPEKTLTLELKRHEPIPITLPSRQLYVVEAELRAKDPVPLYGRCDLAVTHEDATREGTALTAVVHNIGIEPSGPFTVEIATADGRTLATKPHEGLNGIGDMQEKRVAMSFEDLPPNEALTVSVYGPEKEITEVNNAARIQ